MLTITNKDFATLPTEMLSQFKDHLRILDEIEDDLIELYLSGAIDAISTFGDHDIFLTSYEYKHFAADEERYHSTFWYSGRSNLSNVVVKDADDEDITDKFTVDNRLGYLVPVPTKTEVVTFDCGFSTAADMPPNLKTILYRYGAHLYEDRESIKIGDPKNLPDWVNYAIASIWVPRS